MSEESKKTELIFYEDIVTAQEGVASTAFMDDIVIPVAPTSTMQDSADRQFPTTPEPRVATLDDIAQHEEDTASQGSAAPHDQHQTPFLALPKISFRVLVASDARRHLESNMLALEKILSDSGVPRHLWISQVGFDEKLLCGSVGYIQEVLITILNNVKIQDRDLMMDRIGKVLSPFPVVVQIPGGSIRAPIFKSDGTVWKTYGDFIRDHVKILDKFEYDSTRPLYTAATTADGSSPCGTGSGKHSDKDEDKTPGRAEQKDTGDNSGNKSGDNSGDNSHDPEPPAGTSQAGNRPQVEFEITTDIHAGQPQPEILKIAGVFTFKVQKKSESNLGCSTSNIEFLNVDFQGPDTGNQQHYSLRFAKICVDSCNSSSFPTIRQPHDTPSIANEIKEGENKKKIAQTSKSAAIKASVKDLVGLNFGSSHSRGSEVRTASRWTRFNDQITAWSLQNVAKWTYFTSNKEYNHSLNLHANSSELPIVDFNHPYQETPPEEMSVKLSSLWVTKVNKVKNGEAENDNSRNSRTFCNLFKNKQKKTEPVPVYTNLCPCVVITFQTNLSKSSGKRRNFLLRAEDEGEKTEQSEETGVRGRGSYETVNLSNFNKDRASELFD